MRVAVFFCVIVIAGVLTSGYKIEDDEETIEELEEDIEAMEMGEIEDDVRKDEAGEEDRTDHDCKTIKPYTEENLKKESWWREGREFKPKEQYNKYNHAYGLMVVGSETFTDDSMRRACYLMRYIFADNQHMRSMAYKKDFFIVGYNGGFCCPPQMGNKGLSCSCNENEINGKGKSKENDFPFKGKGAPAHEMAHSWLNKILAPLVEAQKMKLPKFIDDATWKYAQPYNENACAKAVKDSSKYGPLWDWLWNAQKLDLLVKATKVTMCEWEHYFIYTGQQSWFFVNDVSRPAAREAFRESNPNMYNLMEMVWPCNNNYVSVCEDGSYGFTKSLAQKFLIGKTDPEDPSKMICKPNIDKGEIEETDVKALETPGDDVSGEDKCMKVAKTVDINLYNDLKSGHGVQIDAFQKYLKSGTEFAWYLRRCCSKTAKFSSAVENQ